MKLILKKSGQKLKYLDRWLPWLPWAIFAKRWWMVAMALNTPRQLTHIPLYIDRRATSMNETFAKQLLRWTKITSFGTGRHQFLRKLAENIKFRTFFDAFQGVFKGYIGLTWVEKYCYQPEIFNHPSRQLHVRS